MPTASSAGTSSSSRGVADNPPQVLLLLLGFSFRACGLLVLGSILLARGGPKVLHGVLPATLVEGGPPEMAEMTRCSQIGLWASPSWDALSAEYESALESLAYARAARAAALAGSRRRRGRRRIARGDDATIFRGGVSRPRRGAPRGYSVALAATPRPGTQIVRKAAAWSGSPGVTPRGALTGRLSTRDRRDAKRIVRTSSSR